MVNSESVTYIQCPSCLRRNNPDMQFCIYCGAGVTPEAEKKRTHNPLSWRTCIRCGQTDELNHNYCIFCSGKIVIPGDANPETSAYKKFSWELEQIDADKVIEKASAAPKSPIGRGQRQAEQQRPLAKRKKRMGYTLPLAVLGMVAGGGLAWIVGTTGLERLVLQSTSWRGRDLVVYTTTPFAEVAIENSARKLLTITQTGADGALSVSSLPAGEYRISISAPGKLGIRQKFPVQENRTTVLGFPNRIELPSPKNKSKTSK